MKRFKAQHSGRQTARKMSVLLSDVEIPERATARALEVGKAKGMLTCLLLSPLSESKHVQERPEISVFRHCDLVCFGRDEILKFSRRERTRSGSESRASKVESPHVQLAIDAIKQGDVKVAIKHLQVEADSPGAQSRKRAQVRGGSRLHDFQAAAEEVFKRGSATAGVEAEDPLTGQPPIGARPHFLKYVVICFDPGSDDSILLAEEVQYQQAFSHIDTNADGHITKEELDAYMRRRQGSITLPTLMSVLHENGRNEIDFVKFCEAMRQTKDPSFATNMSVGVGCLVFSKTEDGLVEMDAEMYSHELVDQKTFNKSVSGLSQAFLGALAYVLAQAPHEDHLQKQTLQLALPRALYCAALSVQRDGASPSFPMRSELPAQVTSLSVLFDKEMMLQQLIEQMDAAAKDEVLQLFRDRVTRQALR